MLFFAVAIAMFRHLPSSFDRPPITIEAVRAICAAIRSPAKKEAERAHVSTKRPTWHEEAISLCRVAGAPAQRCRGERGERIERTGCDRDKREQGEERLESERRRKVSRLDSSSSSSRERRRRRSVISELFSNVWAERIEHIL